MDERDLQKMTVKQLREEAKKLTDLMGVHGMDKAELQAALRKVLGLPEPSKRRIPANKEDLKKEVRSLKVERDSALQAHDRQKLKLVRLKIKKIKRKLRKAG